MRVIIVTPELEELELANYRKELEEATFDVYPRFPNFPQLEHGAAKAPEDLSFLAKVAKPSKEAPHARKPATAGGQVQVPKMRKHRSK